MLTTNGHELTLIKAGVSRLFAGTGNIHQTRSADSTARGPLQPNLLVSIRVHSWFPTAGWSPTRHLAPNSRGHRDNAVSSRCSRASQRPGYNAGLLKPPERR